MGLIDMDGVSYGLARHTYGGRAPSQEVQRFVDTVRATGRELDPHSQIRCAASTETALCHLDVLTASANNEWSIRRGLDGADQALLEEMNYLISTRSTVAKRERKHPARHAELLILAGLDGIYAPHVRGLRLLGIPTWLIVPGGTAAKSLTSVAWAVSVVRPESAISGSASAAGGE
jgi:hypothetical protein